MSSFTIHTIESAPEASKPILAKLTSEIGFTPNLAATMAESSALLEAFTSLRAINGQKSSLSGSDRELASIAVATEYGCSYCVAAHSTFAIKAGAPEGVVAEVREGRPSSDARVAALTTFVRRLIRTGVHVTPEDVHDFLGAGFERRELFDVLATVAQVALASQTFLIASTPLDAAFEPRAWKPAT